MSKLPAIQFYVGDWLKDPAVRACSFAARGLWMDMLCLMWESPRRGYLEYRNGQPITAEVLNHMVGGEVKQISTLLQEMDNLGVYSKTEEGVIFCRRMVRDEELRIVRSKAGSLGGNPLLRKPQNLLNQEVNQQDNQSSKQKPTPSSSVSSSSSISMREREIPDWESVRLYADKVGLAEWKAKDWFNEMEGCGWLDFSNRQIIKWQPVLMRVKAKWEADGRPCGPPANIRHQSAGNGEPKKPSTFELKTKLDVVEKQIKVIRERGSHTATGVIYDETDRDELRKLKGVKSELEKQILAQT